MAGRGQMVSVSSVLADDFEMDQRREAQAALALHEARVHFFPTARSRQRREKQENTEELKQHMARVGDKAQRILCSLSFRAWALTLAEEKRHVAEISCCAGVPLVRRSGHSKACSRVLEEKMRLQRELRMLQCFHRWSSQRSRGEHGVVPYRTPGAARGVALRDGRLLGQVFGLWRIASESQALGASVRSLWSVEGLRLFQNLERKLSAGHAALDVSFAALHGHCSLQRFWRVWVRKMTTKRKAQELHRNCLKSSRRVNLMLSFKSWLSQLRHRQVIGSLIRQSSRWDLSHRSQFFLAWRRFAVLRCKAPRLESKVICSLASGSVETEQNTSRLLALILVAWHHRSLRKSVMQSFQRQHLERHGQQGLAAALKAWRHLRCRNQMLRRSFLRRLERDHQLDLFMVFDYWHRHLKADMRQDDLQRLTLKGTFQRWRGKHQSYVWAARAGWLRGTAAAERLRMRYGAFFQSWKQRTRHRRDVRMFLLKLSGEGHRAAFSAWRRRTRHRRDVTKMLLKQVVTDDENLQRLALSGWLQQFLGHKRRGAASKDGCAARMLANQDRGLLSFVMHGWWSSVLLQRHGGHDRFHVAQRKLLHWRLAHEAQTRRGAGHERRTAALAAAQVLGASEALGEEQRKHFVLARAVMEWRRQLAELREHAGRQRHLGRREVLLQQVAAAWGSDQARLQLQAVWRCWRICAHGNRVEELHRNFRDDLKRFSKAWARGDLLFLSDLEDARRHALFLHWHRRTMEARKQEDMANLEEKLRQVSMARLALAEGLQGAQGSQMSNLFLQNLLMNWHKSSVAQKEERRLLKRRQLAATLVDGSSRLGQQMLLSQTLFAWLGLATESKVADWAKRTAHAQSAKAVLAARIAFGATTGGLSDFVQRWHTAARSLRHSRAKEAARVALETSLKRRNLRGTWDRWVNAWRLDSTERWLQQQKEEAMRQERQLKAGAARKLLQDQTGAFVTFVLQSWSTAARDSKKERRQRSTAQLLVEGLDQSTTQGLVVNAWREATLAAQQARSQKVCAREGSRRLATGLLRFIDGSLKAFTEPLLLRSVWQSWLCVATSGQAIGQALQHDSLQRSAEAELHRLCVNLQGGQRRLVMGLSQSVILRQQMVFDTWRRFRTRKVRARDFIGGLLSQELDLCLHLSVYRWRAWVQTRRRRKQALSKMAYYISQDEICHRRVLWNSWRLLIQDSKAVAGRVKQRIGRCNALQGMVHHFNSTLLMSTLFAWHRAAKATSLRKRFVKGSHSLCETVDGLCQAAQLQAIFTAWVDILLISQTAAMRLGLRCPKEAKPLGFFGAHLSKRSAVDEAQMKKELSEAARAQAMLAPVRLQHLTIQAVFSHWQSWAVHLKEARQLALVMLERFDLAILRACYSGWRDVYGRNPATEQRLQQHQWTLRRRCCFRRVLARQTDPNGFQELQYLVLLLWWRSVNQLRGQRIGSATHLAYLQEVSMMLWTQDRRRELISHAITAWWAAVAQSRTDTSRRAAEFRRMALLRGCDVLTRGEPLLRAAALSLRCLLAWNRLLEADTRRVADRKVKSSICGVLTIGAQREVNTLMSNCLAAWRREAQQVRGGRWLWRRRDNCLQLLDLLETRDRLITFLGEWFLRWRSTMWELRAETFASELQLLASLLQESTITCRELRTQLLTLRGSSCRLGRAALCAILVGWQRVVAERIEDVAGRPPAPAPPPVPVATTLPQRSTPVAAAATQRASVQPRGLRSGYGPRENAAAQRVARLLSITSVKGERSQGRKT